MVQTGPYCSHAALHHVQAAPTKASRNYISVSALTPVLKWTSNTGLICQWNMFVQEYTALTGPTDSQTLSMTL